jgi:hypothetical protein
VAHFHILSEVRTFEPGTWQLCFQYGVYEYDADDSQSRPPEAGYRFIWRRPNGQLQGARGQARLEPELITMLLGMAASEGWYPRPPAPGPSRKVRIGDTLWRVLIQPPVVERFVAEGDHRPIVPRSGLRFSSHGVHCFLPLDYRELPTNLELAVAPTEKLESWLERARAVAVAP